MTVPARFSNVKCYNEIFNTGYEWMMTGDGIVVQVLQTRGTWSYLYYYNPYSNEIIVQFTSLDPTMPVQRWANQSGDRFPKWDNMKSFGTDVKAFRAHLKNNLKKAHGQIERWSSKKKSTERYFAVSDISFVEKADYQIPTLQAVPAATKWPMVIPKKTKACTLDTGNSKQQWMWWLLVALLLGSGIFVFWYTQQCRCVKPQ